MIYVLLAYCLCDLLFFKLRVQYGRFTINDGWFYWHSTWDEGYTMFISSRGLFRVLPIWVYRREWTFYYEQSCSCQFVHAYTRKGAIRKAKKLYPKDFVRFDIDRLYGAW